MLQAGENVGLTLQVSVADQVKAGQLESHRSVFPCIPSAIHMTEATFANLIA
jgi:hypothetical protein